MADIPFVDTHFHLHDLKRPELRYSWLEPDAVHSFLGNIDALKAQHYWIDDYIAEIRFATVPKAIHVQAALLSYLMREGQRLSWPQHWLERLSALLAAMGKLSDMPASHAETHIALAGALAISAGLIGETEEFWRACATDPAAPRWARDRELLKVAGSAREQRTKRAWENLRRPGPAR